MKYNIKKTIIGALSFSTALFVFQACYGTDRDFGLDILIEGKVVSKSSGKPIKGIKVAIDNSVQYQVTDENGNFSIYTEKTDSLKVLFEDIDSTQNGHYLTKDTIIRNFDDLEKLFLDIKLSEK